MIMPFLVLGNVTVTEFLTMLMQYVSLYLNLFGYILGLYGWMV